MLEEIENVPTKMIWNVKLALCVEFGMARGPSCTTRGQGAVGHCLIATVNRLRRVDGILVYIEGAETSHSSARLRYQGLFLLNTFRFPMI